MRCSSEAYPYAITMHACSGIANMIFRFHVSEIIYCPICKGLDISN